MFRGSIHAVDTGFLSPSLHLGEVILILTDPLPRDWTAREERRHSNLDVGRCAVPTVRAFVQMTTNRQTCLLYSRERERRLTLSRSRATEDRGNTSNPTTMINRSSNVSARRVGGGSGGGSNIDAVVIAESSKTKDRRSTSSNSTSPKSFLLPLSVLIASSTLVIMVFGRPPVFLRPLFSSKDHAMHHDSSSLQFQIPSNDDDIKSSLRKHQAVIDQKKYQLTPKRDFPLGWQNYSYDHIRHHFNCQQRSKDMNKPLPTLDDWNFMRRTYTQIVDKNQLWGNEDDAAAANDDDDDDTKKKHVDLVPPTLGYSIYPGIPIPPPYYAKLSPRKGRGLFASRTIHKGELVHDGTINDVIFPSSLKFREYVFSLPRNFACDAAEWIWMQQLEKNGEYHILMGINISSLMNSGGKDWGDSTSKLVNVLPENEYSGKFYAVRDILMGEEILTDYDVYYTKWSLVGLG
jgi:hypothetical protein